MLSTRPIPIKSVINDEPPALTNGRVKPVTGSKFKFIPMFTIVWKVNNVATP